MLLASVLGLLIVVAVLVAPAAAIAAEQNLAKTRIHSRLGVGNKFFRFSRVPIALKVELTFHEECCHFWSYFQGR